MLNETSTNPTALANSKVSVVACQNYEPQNVKKALEKALSLVDGLDWVVPNMKIVVKPNLLLAADPQKAATTNPALVCALCEMLVERGAKVCVGDSPGGLFSKSFLKNVYSKTQFTTVENFGAKLNDDFSSRSIFYEHGKILKNAEIVNFVLNADAVISFAKLKTHSFMGYTGAVKNLFGVIPGTIKAEYHFRMPEVSNFAQMLVDLCEFVSPKLSIIDAVVGMDGEGPSSGNPHNIGAIIASKNPHAADLAGTKIVGLQTQNVPTLLCAKQNGLIENVEFVGDDFPSLVAKKFKTIPHSGIATTMAFQTKSKVINKILVKALECYPYVKKSACIGCQDCKRACPPKVITMENKLPVIDLSGCIRCFCCHELCPVSAMKVHRSVLAKLIRKR